MIHLECGGMKGSLSSSVDAEATDPDHDVAWDASRAAARAKALVKVRDAIADFVCPEECPNKKVTIRMKPIGPECQPDGRRGWTCTTAWEWSVEVMCLKTPLRARPGKRVPLGSSARPTRLKCSEPATFSGTAEGSGNGSTKDEALARAKENSATAARFDVQNVLTDVRCPVRCPEQETVLCIERPTGAGVTKIHFVDGDVTTYDAMAECMWSMTIRCGGNDDE